MCGVSVCVCGGGEFVCVCVCLCVCVCVCVCVCEHYLDFSHESAAATFTSTGGTFLTVLRASNVLNSIPHS